MLNIGITGQSGFIGTHLFNSLGLSPDKYRRIPFEDNFFDKHEKLVRFVSNCDVVIHLAALNRHNDQELIYSTNIALVKNLIEACEKSGATPHIIFSSSTQEERDNLYGRSKKDGRSLFEDWARRNGARFTSLLIPNVYGPFGNPYYNSVVATFCHQLTHNENPKIEKDSLLRLIYVGELVNYIIQKINLVDTSIDSGNVEIYEIPNTSTIKVSELLNQLKLYEKQYLEKGIIPDLSNTFDNNLFNTFLTFVKHNSFFPFHLSLYTDGRGSFAEVSKLNSGGQISFSVTKPGITRGNHFHTHKAERFVVIKGKAIIEFRRIGTSQRFIFELDGEAPSFVDMPVWFTHKITNVGTEDVYTIFWISEHFDPADPDTFMELV